MTKLEQAVTIYYDEPHRFYHTWGHIQRMFSDAGKEGIELTPVQYLAILFHDVVYIPMSQDNERNSVKLLVALYHARPELFAEYSSGDIDHASDIIVDTAEHVPGSPESAVVIDLDLRGLGDSLKEYLAKGEDVKAEFALCTSEQWLSGRKQFLDKFLSREKIFHTEQFAKYEEQARINLEHELNEINT